MCTTASPRFGYRNIGLPPPSAPAPSPAGRGGPPPLLSSPEPGPPLSYLWISVRAEAPRAEPVPAWPYPNSWSGVIALQPVPVGYPRVRMMLGAATSTELFCQWISGGISWSCSPPVTGATRAANGCCDAAGREWETARWRHCLCREREEGVKQGDDGWWWVMPGCTRGELGPPPRFLAKLNSVKWKEMAKH